MLYAISSTAEPRLNPFPHSRTTHDSAGCSTAQTVLRIFKEGEPPPSALSAQPKPRLELFSTAEPHLGPFQHVPSSAFLKGRTTSRGISGRPYHALCPVRAARNHVKPFQHDRMTLQQFRQHRATASRFWGRFQKSRATPWAYSARPWMTSNKAKRPLLSKAIPRLRPF